ncbi:MAG: metallophosphoesterase [archaeon]
MDTKEILRFCLEKGLLLDKEVLGLFSEEGDIDSVKLIIEKLRNHTQKKLITKDLFYENKDQVNMFFSSLPKENQEKLEGLKIKLGLSIEISKEVMFPVKKEFKREVVEDIPGVKILSVNCAKGKKFKVADFIEYFRNRFLEMRGFLQGNPALDNLVSIDKISGIRQGVSLIGMIFDKRITKNKNIIFEIEDLTGKTKVLVNKDKEDLFKKAEEIALDSVIGFRCSGSKEMLFVNDIVFPEAKLFERKKSQEEEYALFIGDVHYGSKKFMKENFLKFIDYLNGKIPNTPEVSKIKYLFIVGDLITGVGNYPNQEKDLEIIGLEDQFVSIAEILGTIRKDIKIIICPGNHEGVRLMEPQPIYDEKYAWALYDLENVILAENPSLVNIGGKKDFPGFNILFYHGFSYQFYANKVPNLMKLKAMNVPEEIMKYLLMHRHLAPTHGSVQYFPCNKDSHVIRQIPDIFISGHTHKSAVSYFNNILVICCSTWEEMTPYQEKFGNVPDHCKVPMVNLKTRAIKILDFE